MSCQGTEAGASLLFVPSARISRLLRDLLNRLGFIPRSLVRFRNGQSKVRHSRMFLAVIQANPDLDPGLKIPG